MSPLNLNGLIAAVVLPMTLDYQPDLPAFRRVLQQVISAGPVGLAINVDTGEGPHLSVEEKRRVLETAVETANGRISIVAGVGGPYTAAAAEQARDAQRIGADGLLVFPIPAYQGEPLDPEIPYRYHRAIADSVDLPLILFQLQPALGGVNFSRETLARLLEIESVAGLKEASFDALRFVQTRALLEEAPHKVTLLNGNDNFLLEAYILGAEGALLGFGCLATGMQVKMHQAWLSQDHPEAYRLARVLQPLCDAIFAPPVRNYRARVKEAFVLLGIIEQAAVRPPLLPVSEAERVQVRLALETAGMLAHAA